MKPEKLTLEHIAGHLPYGLMVYRYNEIPKLVCIPKTYLHPNEKKFGVLQIDKWAEIGFGLYKPLLRRLDLTKPILVEGKEVYPVVELAKQEYREYYFGTNESYNEYEMCEIEIAVINICKSLETISVTMAKWLYKNHYDLDGLIDLNLAIDVDTLEVNPYNS